MTEQLPGSVQLVKPLQTVQTKAQILSLLYEHRQKLKDFGVERYGIFGSFGRDRNIHPLSDLPCTHKYEKRLTAVISEE